MEEILKSFVFLKHEKISKTSSGFTMFCYVFSKKMLQYKETNGKEKWIKLIMKNLNLTIDKLELLNSLFDLFETQKLVEKTTWNLTTLGKELQNSIGDNLQKYIYKGNKFIIKHKKLKELKRKRDEIEKEIIKLEKEINENQMEQSDEDLDNDE